MRLLLIAVIVSSITALGCGGGSSGGGGGSSSAPGAPPGESEGEEVKYDNDHPLIVPTEDPAVLAKEAEIVQLVNDHRVSIGLNALIEAGNIADVARGHSTHMIVHDFFAHTNPEGETPGDRFTRAGIGWSMIGENIAAGYVTATDAYNAWMDSPGHKANIERDGWTHTGVGYAFALDSDWWYYWTQNFLRP